MTDIIIALVLLPKNGLLYFLNNSVISRWLLAIINIYLTDRLILELLRANTVQPVECILRSELIPFDELTTLAINRERTVTANESVAQLYS